MWTFIVHWKKWQFTDAKSLIFHHSLKPFIRLSPFPSLSCWREIVPFVYLHKIIYYKTVYVPQIFVYYPLHWNLFSTLIIELTLLSANPLMPFMLLNSINFYSLYLTIISCVSALIPIFFCPNLKLCVTKAGIFNRFTFNYFEIFGAIL